MLPMKQIMMLAIAVAVIAGGIAYVHDLRRERVKCLAFAAYGRMVIQARIEGLSERQADNGAVGVWGEMVSTVYGLPLDELQQPGAAQRFSDFIAAECHRQNWRLAS